MVTVTSSLRATHSLIRARSWLPSPLGENCWVIPVMRATWGALLSRWATKNAANDATTSRTNAARAKRLNGGPLLRGLVDAREHDDVGVGRERGDVLADRLDRVDREQLGHAATLRAEAVRVIDGGGLQRLVRVVRGGAAGVAGLLLEPVGDRRREAVRRRAVEHADRGL